MPLTEQQLIERLYSVAISGSSDKLLLLLRNIVDPCVTIENGIYRDCSAIDLALINGNIENAECLFENVEAFQSNGSLSICYYHVITKALLKYQAPALQWLKARSSDPNTAHSDAFCRPVHTAIRERNNVALSVLFEDERFDMCLTGNAYEPHGCLTPLQLALLYDNEEAAKLLLKMPNGLEILLARSNEVYDGTEKVERLNAIQFATKIGKIDTLRKYIQDCTLSQLKSGRDINNLIWLSSIFVSHDCQFPDSENKGESPDSERGSCFFKNT